MQSMVLGHLFRMQPINNVESISLPLNNVVHLHDSFWLVEVALFDGRLVYVDDEVVRAWQF